MRIFTDLYALQLDRLPTYHSVDPDVSHSEDHTHHHGHSKCNGVAKFGAKLQEDCQTAKGDGSEPYEGINEENVFETHALVTERMQDGHVPIKSHRHIAEVG